MMKGFPNGDRKLTEAQGAHEPGPRRGTSERGGKGDTPRLEVSPLLVSTRLSIGKAIVQFELSFGQIERIACA